MPKTKDNVDKVYNYYQRRGGYATIHLLDKNGKPNGSTKTIGNWFSSIVKGRKIGGSAGTIVNYRVEKRPATEYIDALMPLFHTLNVRLYAKDVNHDTMPWYVAKEAVKKLK